LIENNIPNLKQKLFLCTFLVFLGLLTGLKTPINDLFIPRTSSTELHNQYISSPTQSKTAFINYIINGDSDHIAGIWLPGLVGLTTVYQPTNQPGFVSEKAGSVTVFQLTEDFGSIGLLAHANKAGAFFHGLTINQIITLIYGDGSLVKYIVTDDHEYQAVDPKNALTDFISTDSPELLLSQEDLFREIYAPPGRLVLQTCIIMDNENYWGRKFIIAEMID
jgi:hypothetical protein